ncbi:MAG: hypothetical protein KBH29_11395 [Lutibacter sp.]|nr:hypothetical protein [Lutibacter sp.]
MKTIDTNNLTPNKYFTVTEKDINTNNAILPNVLFSEMETFIKNIVETTNFGALSSPRLYKLQISGNAFLNDKLLIKSQVVKYNERELQLQAKIIHPTNTIDSTICKAVFKFTLTTTI